MSPELITQIWLWSGLVLMVLEIFLPGLVVVFLGLANVTIALLRWFNIVEGSIETWGWWFVLSTIYLLVLRTIFARFLPGDTRKEVTSEEAWEMGTVVQVIEPVTEKEMNGRVRYSGTTWPARALDGKIETGESAQIIAKEGIGYLIRRPD